MAQYLLDVRTPDVPNLEFVYTTLDDPQAAAMLAELQAEYDRLYESQAQAAEKDKEINTYPASAFTPEEKGAFVLLKSGDETVAGGAIMASRDPLAPQGSGEFKRIWTNSAYRGRGLAKFMLNELEWETLRLGYDHVFLTTGPNQPEAVALYERCGYDRVEVDNRAGHIYHAFSKPLLAHRSSAQARPRGFVPEKVAVNDRELAPAL